MTGKWFDKLKGATYGGAFQFRIHLGGDAMSGKWLGFNENGEIRSGVWEWKRAHLPQYGSEEAR